MFSDELPQKLPCFKKERSNFEAECITCGYGTFISVANKGNRLLALMTALKPQNINRLLEVKPHLLK